MRVLVCGSRSWNDGWRIGRRLEALERGSVVIHGGARGADRIAGEIAHTLGFEVEEWRANWHEYGRAAGKIRNKLMIETQPDLVVAFWDGASRGTVDTITRAIRAKIPVEVHGGPSGEPVRITPE